MDFSLKEFQLDTMEWIVDSFNDKSNHKLILEAPTGSGKTIMLIKAIENYLLSSMLDTVFIWLTPGAGELEEQSLEKMKKVLPNLSAKRLSDVLAHGFKSGDTVFINWESVSTNTRAVREREKAGLHERIKEAHLDMINFIVIVDESHRNRTSIAQSLISDFSPIKQLYVSATPIEEDCDASRVIDESVVIGSGLITKEIYLNERVISGEITSSNHDTYLIDKAEEQRLLILNEYNRIQENINPLVIIQFPNESDEKINQVAAYLESKGYTYENGKLALWLAGNDKKRNLDNINQMNGPQCFLLMKQAISTGWDCPRAKVLVGLREGMGETFKIQTLGRIRRMPNGNHYENEILDCCYLYTLDEDFIDESKKKANVLERKLVLLKDKPKELVLKKQISTRGYNHNNDEATVLEVLYRGFIGVGNLENNFSENYKIFIKNGYKMGDDITNKIKIGSITELNQVSNEKNNLQTHLAKFKADKISQANDVRRVIYKLNKIMKLPEGRARAVLERLFIKQRGSKKWKILSLGVEEFTAFLINNEDQLYEFINNLSSSDISVKQMSLDLIHEVEFKIPHEEWYPYDKDGRVEGIFEKNAYNNYVAKMVTDKTRSTCERLFENYCESNDSVEWFYKNGDKGDNYFSIVYVNAFGYQKLFYADYIVKFKNDDSIWIIEAKGGENSTGSKNIDKFSERKFKAFKKYAETHNNINWGFVRDKNEKLYLNNTEYCDSMSSEEWVAIEKIF